MSAHSKVRIVFVFNFPTHEDLAQVRYTRVILDNKHTLRSFLDYISRIFHGAHENIWADERINIRR